MLRIRGDRQRPRHPCRGAALRPTVIADNGNGVTMTPEMLDHARELREETSRKKLAVEYGALHWAALELSGPPPPRTWWIQDWLTPAPTLCAGSGGVGKSVLWQTIGTALAMGREFLGATAAPLRVLLWACEDDAEEIWRRQAAICSHFEIPLADLEGRFIVMARHGCDNTLIAPVMGQPTFTPAFETLREQVNDLDIDVLALDNNAQVYGCNENDRHQVTLFVNAACGLVRGRRFAPVFLGHTARTAGSEFSGSAAWENACRMRWYMGTTLPDQKPDEDETADAGIVYLAKRKANYSEKDWRRLRYQDGLFIPEECHGRRFDQGYRDDLAERLVLKGMGKLAQSGIQPTDSANSPDYLPRQIVAKGLNEGHTKKELAAAMNRLMGAGKLKRDVVGKYPNRTPRQGLVVMS